MPIRLINPDTNRHIEVKALLDTGADSCMLPKFIAEATGHDLKNRNAKCTNTKGISGIGLECWEHTFVIELISPDGNNTIWRSQPNLMSCVEHDNAPALLGTEQFLKNFKIRFNYIDRLIEIELP